MGRHVLAVPAVDDHGLAGAESLGHPGRVHGRVAAPIDRHSSAQSRRLPGLHTLQETDGVENLPRIPGRNVHPLGEVGANGHENGVETTGRLFRQHVLDFVVEDNADTEVLDPPHFRVQHLPGQPIGRDSEMHHAAGHRPCLADFHLVPQAAQVIRDRQSARAGAHHQDLVAAFLGGTHQGPALVYGQVPEIPLHCVDADGHVQHGAITGALAGVVTDPAVHGGQGIVASQNFPRPAETPGMDFRQPGLDVLARRAAIVAGRQIVHVFRPATAQGA